MADPIPFPQKLGTNSPRTQFDELKTMSTGELLAAWTLKYPDCTFSADELIAAKGKKVRVHAIGRNEWQIEVHEAGEPTP